MKQELCLAIWPGTEPLQYWNPTDSNSFWLYLRKIEISEEGKVDTYSDETIRKLALWHWASPDYAPSVELKAHEIYSADARKLKAIAKVLEGFQKKIERASIPRDFGLKEQAFLTLSAMGVKRAVLIDPDWQSPTRYTLLSLQEGLSYGKVGVAFDRMAALRRKDAA